MKPGQKLVIDVDENKLELSELTADEVQGMRADRADRVENFRQRWETSRDREALLGALIFHQTRLPQWLFKGLTDTFGELSRNIDAIRFFAVRHAHDALHMTMDEAYDWASEHLANTPARGGRDTMMKSYQKIGRRVAPMDHIERRPRARRRRR
jgi:hypothetical protein